MRSGILAIAFFFMFVSCEHKERKVVYTKSQKSCQIDTLKQEKKSCKIDTLELENIKISVFIPLSSFDCLMVDISNESTDSLPLRDYCIQIKEKTTWKTLFCDSMIETIIPPKQSKRIKADLHLDEFRYSSKELYRFIAYCKKNNAVYRVSKIYYSMTIFKQNGKVYMLPDTVIDNDE